MLCTVREALVIREGARHRVSRGKEVSAAWRGRKKSKKRCRLGWPACVIPTKDTLKGEEVTQSESPEIGSFTQKSAEFEYHLSGPVKSLLFNLLFFFVFFEGIIFFDNYLFFFSFGILYFISRLSIPFLFLFFCRRALSRFGLFFLFFC